MSESTLSLDDRRWSWLAQWLRPRGEDHPEEHLRGRLWRTETALLLLVGVVLAVATVNDLVRQAHINQRLVADLSTWRHYTHHDYHNVSIDQQTLGVNGEREVLCGNTSAGAPGSRTQVCLTIWGPVAHNRRTVHGGWYLPRYVEDQARERYGCFGVGGHGRCRK